MRNTFCITHIKSSISVHSLEEDTALSNKISKAPRVQKKPRSVLEQGNSLPCRSSLLKLLLKDTQPIQSCPCSGPADKDTVLALQWEADVLEELLAELT